jgi:hypothetical protein
LLTRTADSFVDHLRRHRHLNRALIFTSAAGVHRANRPTADQSGRDEIQTLGRLFANEALLAAAVAASLVSGFQALFDHFEVLGQWPYPCGEPHGSHAGVRV